MDIQSPHLRAALSVSLLLHAALLAVIAWMYADSVGPARQNPQYITIEFAARPARSRIQPQAQELPTPVAATGEASASAATSSPLSLAEPVQPATATSLADSAITAIESSTAAANAPGAALQDNSAATPTSLDTARLQQSIAGLATSLRSTNTQRWMQDCKPERNKELPDDCPTRRDNRSAERAAADAATDALFDSWISGHDRNDRISRQLLADMNALRPLMEQKGLLAELASERYYFKREQYRYLNGMEATPGGSRDSTIRWATFGPGGITLLGGLMQIEFDGKIKWGEEQTRGPALPFRLEREPCDYAEGCEPDAE